MQPDYQKLAEAEGLSYVTDNRPGYTRRKFGKGFTFYDVKGQKITDEKEIKRIRSIGIPPAYKNVWISPSANGHIQATGLDARGRKQYRYHTKWRELRDSNKYEHILHFGESLQLIRAKTAEHMALPGLSREKVLATVVMLLAKTLIRVGNEEYARNNKSYGLTTLRKKHIDVSGADIRFHFTGKSGKKWNLSMHDRRIAAVVKKCSDLPGYELFKYIDDSGAIKDVTSGDVNTYLKEISGEDFTAKDFRTWSGTVLAAMALSEFEKYDSATQAKKNVVRAIEKVSKQLGNTPAICRKCYIHPEVINTYLDGNLKEMISKAIDTKFKNSYSSLNEDEVMVLAFLKRKLA